jgi:choline-sulfatase
MLDHEIGRVLAELQKLGLSENTFVMMTSDNGHMFGSHGVQDKMSWFEGSARLPAVVRWPAQISRSTKVKSGLSSVDLLPTLLDLAGLPPVQSLDAYSMMPALRSSQPLRGPTFSEMGVWEMVRKGPWKLVRLAEDGTNHRLYNIEKDPLEMNNLIGKEGSAEIIFQLNQEIAAWKLRTQPVPNAHGVRKTDVPQEPGADDESED